MPATSLSFSFLKVLFFITNVMPLLSLSSRLEKADKITHRNLDFTLPSVLLRKQDDWYNFYVRADLDDSGDLYMPTSWAIFISSNETILNNGGCPLFGKFTCSSPDCYEDTTSLYSQKFPIFSTSEATRLNLSAKAISIAGGAWQINSALYLDSCEIILRLLPNMNIQGQIGLGLSGSSYQNFKTPNPIFSIIFYNRLSAELIFGLNPTYINESITPISLPCDLDWKIQVNSMSIGTSAVVDYPVTLIFDLHSGDISLPPAYYSAVKTYLFQTLRPESCFEEHKTDSFYCFYHELSSPPPLVFNLEDGMQFILSSNAYTAEGARMLVTRIVKYNSTFSGVEYIIVGRITMFNFYTVFQRLDNQTPTITLYPVTHTLQDSDFGGDRREGHSNHPEVITEPNSSREISPSLNITLETNPPSTNFSENKNTSDTSEPQSPSNSSKVQTENPLNHLNLPNDNAEDPGHIIYTIVVIILIILICGVGVYLHMKRRGVKHVKMVKGERSTLELKGNSYFVPSKSNIQDDNESNMSE